MRAGAPQDLTTRTGNVRTEAPALTGVGGGNASETEDLVCLRYFNPKINPLAPAMGANKNP